MYGSIIDNIHHNVLYNHRISDIYYRKYQVIFNSKENGLLDISLCFISDDLNHDVCFVHQVISDIINYIKEDIF